MKVAIVILFLAAAAVGVYSNEAEDSVQMHPRFLLGLGKNVVGKVFNVVGKTIDYFFGSSAHIAQFQKECLDKHNTYRSLHGVPMLQLDSGLSKYAQEWAEKLAKMKTMVLRGDNKYGENIWMMRTSDPDPKVHGGDAVESWYKDELPLFQFGVEPKGNLKAGHLTQVLWASSRRLGVGVAKHGDYVVVVCNYDPSGNYVGKFNDNVPAIGGKPFSSNTKTLLTTKKSEPKPSKTSAIDEEYVKELVLTHNEKRELHGVPALAYNPEIAEAAQEWADKLAAEDSLKVMPDSPYGQNIYKCSAQVTASHVINYWYKENEHYKSYTEEPDKATFSKVGQFTQMTWKSSTEVGCGKSVDKTGAMRVVCFYNPKGNYVGQFVDNVMPPQ